MCKFHKFYICAVVSIIIQLPCGIRAEVLYGPSILHLVTVKVIIQNSDEFFYSYGCYHDSVFQDVTS